MPYWLVDNPHELEASDHLWWFHHLVGYKTIVFIGPYIRNSLSTKGEQTLISIQTHSLRISLGQVFQSSLFPMGIRPSDIHLYWHVIEVAATCRVDQLDLLRCPKVCAIGDTHHMHRPITGLYEYLTAEQFSHVCCSHNQYNPFFSAVIGLTPIDFPFSLPPETTATERGVAMEIKDRSLYYYGSLVSRHHLHRSRIINTLLTDRLLADSLVVRQRMSFSKWRKNVLRPHHNLTCSLNGTFSFQTFLPMLGGACIYTDPISDSNWVGAVLRSGENCIVYESARHLADSFLFIHNTSDNGLSIGRKAKHSILLNLFTAREVQENWMKGIPEGRILTTSKEKDLEKQIVKHMESYGKANVTELVKIFEDIQELHRLHWLLDVRLSASFTDRRMKCYALMCQRTLQLMLGILPRCTIATSECTPLVPLVDHGQPCLHVRVLVAGAEVFLGDVL